MNIEHLLVATDLSDEMRARIPYIGHLARMLRGRITLLHVIGGHEAIPHGAPLAPPLKEPADPAALQAALEELRELATGHGDGVSVTPKVVAGDPAHEIVEQAQLEGANMIVVGTHGRTGFRHMVLGSVAEAVVQRAKVPVLVVPRPEA